jgi:hypothetical protein
MPTPAPAAGAADATAPALVPALPVDARASSRLAEAAAHARRKDWQKAVVALQEIVDARRDVLVRLPGADESGEPAPLVSAWAQARRQLSALPPEGRQVYDGVVGPAASKLLAQAQRSADTDLLREVARRYLDTAAGLDAVGHLARQHAGRREWHLAAGRYQQLLARRAAPRWDAEDLLQATVALRRSGEVRPADVLEQELLERAGKDGLRVGDKTLNRKQLLADVRAAVGRNAAWPLYRRDPVRANTTGGGPVVSEPAWSLPLVHHESDRRIDRDRDPETRGDVETDKRLYQALSLLRQRHEPVLPAFFPITDTAVKGDSRQALVIYRDYWGVQAHNLKDGRLRWWAPASLALQRMLGGADRRRILALNNWLAYYLDQQQRPQIVFENSLAGTLSTDNAFVYVIDDLAAPPPQQSAMNWGDEVNAAIRHNRLQAFSLARSGALDWEAGGEGDKGELADCFFLGPPLPLGGKLYVLVQKGKDLRLACLDPAANGKVVGVQTLASTAEGMEYHVVRRTHAVHLAYGEGILVVPTNAGAVLGINLLENRLAWAYPYRDKDDGTANGRRGLRLPGRSPPGVIWGPDGRPILPIPNTGAWKEAAPAIAEGKVVFTAPDSRSLHCVTLSSGARNWTYRRQDDDLYFAGIYRGKVLVVGKKECRALDLATGRLTWKVDLSMPPSGQGIASDNLYYLPLHDTTRGKERSEICAIDIDRGAVIGRSHPRGNEAPGNLLFVEGGLVSVSATSVAFYHDITVLLARVNERLAHNANDPTALIDRARLRRQGGDLAGAIDDLRKARRARPGREQDVAAADMLFECINDLMTRDFAAAVPLLGECDRLCDAGSASGDGEQARANARQRRVQFLVLVGRGREAQGRFDDALQAWLDLAALGPGGEMMAVPEEPGLQVRIDAWVRHRIEELGRKAAEQKSKESKKAGGKG